MISKNRVNNTTTSWIRVTTASAIVMYKAAYGLYNKTNKVSITSPGKVKNLMGNVNVAL